ncbi:MAG: LapA family protein [Deltaproteobacteria bacterium]|nr:LapA family protein [Deltaproteobacteria bacterium]
MRLVLIVLVILMGLFAMVAIQNPGIVTINFFNYFTETSILVVIVAAFGAGVIVGFLPGIPASFKRRRRIRELESDLAAQRKSEPPPPPPVTP